LLTSALIVARLLCKGGGGELTVERDGGKELELLDAKRKEVWITLLTSILSAEPSGAVAGRAAAVVIGVWTVHVVGGSAEGKGERDGSAAVGVVGESEGGRGERDGSAAVSVVGESEGGRGERAMSREDAEEGSEAGAKRGSKVGAKAGSKAGEGAVMLGKPAGLGSWQRGREEAAVTGKFATGKFAGTRSGSPLTRAKADPWGDSPM
jgi:hypothetical protein